MGINVCALTWQGGAITSRMGVIKALTYCFCLFTWNPSRWPLPSHDLLEEGEQAVVILQ